jgi:hypothetical protein
MLSSGRMSTLVAAVEMGSIVTPAAATAIANKTAVILPIGIIDEMLAFLYLWGLEQLLLNLFGIFLQRAIVIPSSLKP